MNFEIVVGIDFGTTFSGVSWAVNGGNKVVNLITNWPNPHGGALPSEEKVPSVIAYDENGQMTKWGFPAQGEARRLCWFKLLLEPKSESNYAENAEQVKKSRQLLDELGKSATDVITDYLSAVWAFVLKEIEKKRGSDFRNEESLKVIMSVPAMWSQQAKDKTKQAAMKATGLDDVELVAEPEAAALATMKARDEMNQLKVDDCFVVCDAGGGTVDLISYEVQNLKPLRVRECAVGEGDLCGSVWLDVAFQKWVVTLIGQQQWMQCRDRNKLQMLREFEALKRGFNPTETLEYPVSLYGIENDARLGIQDDTIIVRSNSVITIFDGVCNQVKHLVQKQLSQIRKKNKVVKNILLVGGFGESGYLFDQLRAAHEDSTLRVLQVEWSAICRGATLWGLEHSQTIEIQPTVVERMARYSYGIEKVVPFIERRHKESDKYWAPERQEYMARNQIHWMIRKGDGFENDQILSSTFTQTIEGRGFLVSFVSDLYNILREQQKYAYNTKLYYSALDIPPLRADAKDVKPLCDIRWQLHETDVLLGRTRSYTINKQKYRDAELILQVTLGNADLAFGIRGECLEKPLQCKAEYPEA